MVLIFYQMNRIRHFQKELNCSEWSMTRHRSKNRNFGSYHIYIGILTWLSGLAEVFDQVQLFFCNIWHLLTSLEFNWRSSDWFQAVVQHCVVNNRLYGRTILPLFWCSVWWQILSEVRVVFPSSMACFLRSTSSIYIPCSDEHPLAWSALRPLSSSVLDFFRRVCTHDFLGSHVYSFFSIWTF